MTLAERHGTQTWANVSRDLAGRSEQQCRER